VDTVEATPSASAADRRRGSRCRLVAAAALVAACACTGPSYKALDSAVFYEGPKYRLKAVRYHENLPLHYVGEAFIIGCVSEGTRDAVAGGGGFRVLGMRMLLAGGAIGTKSVQDVVARERHRIETVSDDVLVVRGLALTISTDACASFVTWNPALLPEKLIDPVEKPDYCAPKGTGDCRDRDFEGDRAPVYDALEIRPDRISFRMRSAALRAEALHVTSAPVWDKELGGAWTYEVIGPTGSADPAP